MAGEFAEAVVRLSADDSALRAGLQATVKGAHQAGAAIEAGFASGAKGPGILTSEISRTASITRSLTGGIAGELNPALGDLVARMTAAGGAGAGFGLAFSVAAAGAAAVAVGIGAAIAKEKELREAQIALNTALRTTDTGKLEALARAAGEVGDRIKVLNEEMRSFNPLRSVPAALERASILEDEVLAKARIATTELQRLNREFDRPAKESALQIAANDVRQSALAFSLQRASSEAEVDRILTTQLDLLQASTQEQQKSVRLTAERAAQAAMRSGNEIDIIRTKQALTDVEKDQARVEAQALQREREILETGQARKDQIEEAARARLDTEKTISSTLARSDVERATIEREFVIEIAKLDERRFADKQALLERELEQLRSNATLTKEARAKLEADITQDLNRLVQDRERIEDAHRQKRVAADEAVRQAEFRMDELLFQKRMALGTASVRDEIDRLNRIAAATNRNVEERINAEIRAADRTKALRDEAQGAALDIIGQLEEMQKAGTLQPGTFTEQIQQLQKAKQDVIRGFQEGERTGRNPLTGGPNGLAELRAYIEAARDLLKIAESLRKLGAPGIPGGGLSGLPPGGALASGGPGMVGNATLGVNVGTGHELTDATSAAKRASLSLQELLAMQDSLRAGRLTGDVAGEMLGLPRGGGPVGREATTAETPIADSARGGLGLGFRFVDDKGVPNFVGDRSQIPPQFRDQAEEKAWGQSFSSTLSNILAPSTPPPPPGGWPIAKSGMSDSLAEPLVSGFESAQDKILAMQDGFFEQLNEKAAAGVSKYVENISRKIIGDLAAELDRSMMRN